MACAMQQGLLRVKTHAGMRHLQQLVQMLQAVLLYMLAAHVGCTQSGWPCRLRTSIHQIQGMILACDMQTSQHPVCAVVCSRHKVLAACKPATGQGANAAAVRVQARAAGRLRPRAAAAAAGGAIRCGRGRPAAGSSGSGRRFRVTHGCQLRSAQPGQPRSRRRGPCAAAKPCTGDGDRPCGGPWWHIGFGGCI
jgi:hypothetical protein